MHTSVVDVVVCSYRAHTKTKCVTVKVRDYSSELLFVLHSFLYKSKCEMYMPWTFLCGVFSCWNAMGFGPIPSDCTPRLQRHSSGQHTIILERLFLPCCYPRSTGNLWPGTRSTCMRLMGVFATCASGCEAYSLPPPPLKCGISLGFTGCQWSS